MKTYITDFVNNVLNKYKFQETPIVCVRLFHKQLCGRVVDIDKTFSIFGNLSISLAWTDYL
jgi:hypothetical protein